MNDLMKFGLTAAIRELMQEFGVAVPPDPGIIATIPPGIKAVEITATIVGYNGDDMAKLRLGEK